MSVESEEMKNGYWLWENPMTKEIEILLSKEERDRKQKTYTAFMDMVDEIGNEGDPLILPGI